MTALPWYLEKLNPTVFLDASLWLSLDFETTNREKGSALEKENRVVLASWSEGAEGAAQVAAVPMGPGRAALKELREAAEAARILIAHNAKFELQWLARLGIPTDHLLVLDTMIAEYVLAGNRRWTLDLDSVSRRYGLGGKDPVIDALMKGGVCPSDMPLERLKARVKDDVVKTRALAIKQLAELQRLGLLPVFFTRCITTPVLADMETAGMALDPALVAAEHAKTLAELGAAERELADIAGGINLRSTPQLAALLYDTLKFPELTDRKGIPKRNKPSKAQPGGARLTDSETLEKLKATTPEQKRFVKLRKQWGLLNARLTKSLEFFRHICDERDGVFYASIHQCRTQTHRLASSGRRVTFSDGFEGGAQFQNLAREYKKLFRARQGQRGVSGKFVLVETDGSGLEFRVAAFLGQDERAQQDIRDGADVHRYTASIICDKPEEAVTKKERTAAKAHTFKPLYGGQSGTPREVKYYEAFKAKYSAIAQTQKGWVADVLATRQLRTASGLILYWSHCRMSSDGYIADTPLIFNYPIQGFATADIIPIALVYLYWSAKAEGIRCRLINTVHDSVLAEVHEDDVEDYKRLAVTAFLDSVYGYLERVYGVVFDVPLGVGMNVATHWGEGEEESVSYGREEVSKT